MNQDMKDAIDYILQNFSMAEADEIASYILEFLEAELTKLNNQNRELH